MTAAKRVLDVAGATAGLLVLAPLFAVIALLVRVEDGGPAFFLQERVGYQGRVFRMWKFRTMVRDAESRGLPLTVGRDPRVTRVGAWLRRLKVDELPQLLNVLIGNMTLVGPRPEVPRYVALYDGAQRRVLGLVPGITDEASIRYSEEDALLATAADPERFYVDELMGEKIRINLEYAARATVWTDVGVILATLRHLFWPRDPTGRSLAAKS
jgi:lipopolysaccharide/colanic/teichoic acid biosynthesis glycosyltransferase